MSQLKSFNVSNEIMRAQKNVHRESTSARVVQRKHVSFTRVIIRSLVLTALVPEDVSEAAKQKFEGSIPIRGLNPGPLLFVEHKDFVWGLIASMYLGNVVGLVLVLTTVPIFASIPRVPFAAVAPMIVVSCAIGAYAIQNAMFAHSMRRVETQSCRDVPTGSIACLLHQACSSPKRWLSR